MDIRARVLAALKDEVAQHGYANTTVTAIAGRAKVPRPSFYEIFADKEACLLAAFAEAASALAAEAAASLDGANPRDAHLALVDALARLARDRPLDFNLVTQDALVAGPRALHEHSAFVDELSTRLESRWSRARASDRIPDLPAFLVIAGVIRYLGMALRRGSLDLPRDVRDLGTWIESYSLPSRSRTWRDLAPARGLSPPAPAMGNRIGPPRPLPARGSIPAAAYAAIEREHIVHAAAALISDLGFDATDVAAITAGAGVPREAFYRHFDDKRAIVQAVATSLFERAMAAVAGAYFAPGTPWTDRIWQSSWALTTVLASSPSFTQVAFIDAFASDPVSARHADERLIGFTIFLADGTQEARIPSVPAVVPRAITMAFVELGVRCAVHGTLHELPGLVPLGTRVALAPYLGIQQANEFVESRARGRGRRGGID